MSASKLLMPLSIIDEAEEDIPEKEEDTDLEDRYVRKVCIHGICEEKSVTAIDSEISGEAVEEEYINLEEINKDDDLDETFPASDFTDADCGEPMQSQFLRLDFTPIEGVDDNPHILKKCSDFWQFIYSQTKLQGLMVMPEKGYEEVIAASSSETSLEKCQNVPTPALEWLETGVGQKMAFAAKHESKYCDHHNGDYMEETSSPKIKAAQKQKSAEKGSHQLSTSSQFDPVVGSKVFSSLNALELCTQLEEWDRQHPKSMDPPGRVPNLTHAILQRKRQER